jgi:hypothetical protein
MRYISLLLISILTFCYTAEADTSVSQAVAVKVASIMKKNEDAIKVANDTALKDLKKLLLANKKDKNGSVLIALKINKLDKADKDAIELIKDIPPESQDLLGAQGDADKYISEVKAKLIVEALAKNKLTSQDWDNLPGKGIEVTAPIFQMPIQGRKGARFLMIPHPTETIVSTIAGGSKKQCNWRQASLSAQLLVNDEIRMQIALDTLLPFTSDGSTLRFHFPGGAEGGDWHSKTGFIRVKVYEVVPLE